MQAEIDAAAGAPAGSLIPSTGSPIHILGINAVGQESGNELICTGRSIPWLQDVAGQNVWSLWGVDYRDVVILDAFNNVVAVYNLTEHDLSKSGNYKTLKELLLDYAGR